MPTPICRGTAILLLALPFVAAFAAPVAAQEEPAAPATPPAATPPAATPPAVQQPHHVVVRYPQDRDRPIAEVGDRTLTLGDLVDRIDERHYPSFREALAERAHVQRMLQSDLIAPWVRQFADLEALRQTFADDIVEEPLDAAQSEALRQQFQAWLDAYVQDLAANGRPTEMTQRRVDALLADFQLRQGLAAELQGLLDHLESDDYNRAQLQHFFQANARYFGGRVTIAHILIQHRDAGTGILLADEGLARAHARLADVRARLRPDGSNFQEVARSYSDDTRTAKEGGKLENIARFDDRLPAALCRAAWHLADGEVSDVVETQYGWHLIQRLEFSQQMFILFTDDAIPTIRGAMKRARQEDRLFHARERAKVRLLL